MLLHQSIEAAEEADAVDLVTARKSHRLAVELAAKLRVVCWPVAVLFWRLCVGRGPAAWS
jgi:hypothetical protein